MFQTSAEKPPTEQNFRLVKTSSRLRSSFYLHVSSHQAQARTLKSISEKKALETASNREQGTHGAGGAIWKIAKLPSGAAKFLPSNTAQEAKKSTPRLSPRPSSWEKFENVFNRSDPSCHVALPTDDRSSQSSGLFFLLLVVTFVPSLRCAFMGRLPEGGTHETFGGTRKARLLLLVHQLLRLLHHFKNASLRRKGPRFGQEFVAFD